jgi:hypothetical protein
MAPPNGYVGLLDAVDLVGRKEVSSSWKHRSPFLVPPVVPLEDGWAMGGLTECLQPSAEWWFAGEPTLDPEVDRVITMIAECCAAGEISAVYRSIDGFKELDRNAWLRPDWRNFFTTGTIHLNLPRLDVNGRPDPSGLTVRCEREIFLRRKDLDRFIATLSEPTASSETVTPSKPRASKKQIRDMVTNYRLSLSPPGNGPSQAGLVQFARVNHLRGHRDDLLDEYRRQFPDQRVGRPVKK